MGVFVDDMLLHAAVRNGPRIVRGRWSHLTADSSDELREFAGRLRLNPAWIQEPATVLEHYDITVAVRAHALAAGCDPDPLRGGRLPHLVQTSGHPLRRRPAPPGSPTLPLS